MTAYDKDNEISEVMIINFQKVFTPETKLQTEERGWN